MSHVYMVVATKDAEIEVCEAYAGVQSALGRGFQLASDKAGRGRTDLFIPDPKEETLLDGTIRWVFMDTNKQSVMVFYREIATSLLSSRDPMSVMSCATKDVLPPPPPAYDIEDRSLPVGWFYDGKPALMADMQDHPYDVKDPVTDLTDNQKWALTLARVKKSPGYRQIPKGYSGFTADQAFALKELEGRTQTGQQIRDAEIEMLQILRANYTDQ